ncbi:uncharacterized protein [Rutidosis leptorrhynchoides]|uniref:uncharacterized protein n=1 Tax=Rutidosis leptorrhynchoides TaxID=125765 RepID=UPI003A993BAD
MKGDYAEQYVDLRNYGEELIRCNPGTTVRIQTEPCDPMETEKVFKRIFGLDSNNGTYPVVYAIVEQERIDSWSWFPECLGKDLDLERNSNFTFISDRQKGLLEAVSIVFPCAEHRYCVKHIHENMKTKGFTGKVFKQHLWKCATATTVPHFEKAMLELKGFRRCKSDVLINNICEVFNRWLVDARDKPIVACLEYIREYLMQRIVTVIEKSANIDGPFTPGGKKMFDLVRKEAHKLQVLWSGNELYQVNGFSDERYVVNL